MAVIDPKRLLPSSNKSENSDKFLVPISSIVLKKNVAISSKLLKPEAQKEDSKGGAVVLNKIVDKLVKVEGILKSNLVSQISQQNKKEREQKQKEAEEREKKLEIKPENKGKVPLPSLPRVGFLDAFRNYLINTLLGFVAVKLFDMAPKLIKFLDAIKPVAGFIGEFAGNLFNGLVEFVDKGYKAYDEVQKFVKNVGGEGAEKLFNDFSKNLNTLLNGAIIASMIAISTAPKRPGGVSGGAGAGTAGAAKAGAGVLERGSLSRLNESYSRYIAGKANIGDRARLLRRGFIGGRQAIARGGTEALAKGVARNAAQTAATQGAKQSARFAISRAPIIGALIGFIIDTVIFREKPTRAAAGAVGNAIGSAVGAGLLGGGTFGLGAGVGLFVGGWVGDWIGKALYDTITSFSQEPIQAKAQGGAVSSGGKKTPPVRKIKVQKAKPKKIITQRTQPGKDVGGLKKIEELYGKDEPGTRSALRALKKSSEEVKRMKSLNGLSGAMFGAGIDMALGQKPDKNLAASLGGMFGAVIQTAIDSELNNAFGDITKTIAMANGGVVPSRELKSNMSIGERIGRYISSALTISIESSATKILQNLNKELRLEGGPAGEEGGSAGDGAGPMVSSDSADFWLLSLISLYENSNPQGAADVAQSIYNRMGYNGKSARENILARNQYEPVGKFGSVADWNKVVDKQSALNHIKKFPGNGASADGLEKVAAALLDPSKQKSAAIFVGNRPDFRSDGYEKSYNEMVEDTSRHGQTFGFNRGSSYLGKSFVAQRIPSLVKGKVQQKITYMENRSGYKPSNPGPFNIIQYITGDRNHSNFEYKGHGTEANYHDHIAFKTIADKERAKAALRAAGIQIGSEYRPGDPGYHGVGLAIDIPGFQWGGSGTIGKKEYDGSARVRSILGIDGLPVKSTKSSQNKNKPSTIFNWNSQSSIQNPSQSTQNLSSSTSQQIAFLGNFSADKTGISNISKSVSNYSEASEGPSSSTLAIQEIHYVYG